MAALSAIDLSPLMDLAFSMLIIFMISTPMMQQQTEQKVDVELPKTTVSLASPSDVKSVALSVKRNGEFYVGSDRVSLAQMDARLRDLALQSEPPVLSIRGDKAVTYQKVMDIINLVKKHKLTKISLDTEYEG